MLVRIDVESAFPVNLRCCYLSKALWVDHVSVFVQAKQQRKKEVRCNAFKRWSIRLSIEGRHGSKWRWTDQTSFTPVTTSNLCISSSSPRLFLTLLLTHRNTCECSFCYWLSHGSFVLSELNCSSAALFELAKPYFVLRQPKEMKL